MTIPSTTPPSESSLPAETRLGAATLRVRDLTSSLEFYRERLGLALLERSETGVTLGAASPILRLEAAPDAPAPPRSATGLYHAAIVLPERRALAETVLRLSRSGYPLQGASDHDVSEAFYLADPEGNGLELYRDRPRSAWRYPNGQLLMTLDPVDEAGIFGTLEEGAALPARVPADTRLGHLHLRVDDLAGASAFYGGVLGFAETTRLPGALFMAAGGYHHHFGFNTWGLNTSGLDTSGLGTRTSVRAPEGALGLRGFTLELPLSGLAALRERIEAARVPYAPTEAGLSLRDPWGHEISVEVGVEVGVNASS